MQEYKSLSDLKASTAGFSKTKNNLTIADAYEKVTSKLDEDERLKDREKVKVSNVVHDKTWYKNNFDFYQEIIKKTILDNGIAVYDEKTNSLLTTYDAAREITSMCVGYDCLEDAMSDDGITDIYCLA